MFQHNSCSTIGVSTRRLNSNVLQCVVIVNKLFELVILGFVVTNCSFTKCVSDVFIAKTAQPRHILTATSSFRLLDSVDCALSS